MSWMIVADTWRRGWFPAAFAVLAVASVMPLVLFRALPGQDLPNHVAIVEALARRGSEPGWSEVFTSRLGLSGYSGFYLLGTGLAGFLGAEVACRLLLALYVVGTPLSVLYFARSVVDGEGARWAALLAFAFLFGDAYLVGFAPFMLSLPLVFCAGGLAVRAALEQPRRRQRTVGLAVLGLCAYAAHPMGAALLVGVAGGSVCLFAASFRGAATVLAGLVPVVALLAGLALGGSGDAGGASSHLGTSFKFDYLVRTPVFIADAMPGWFWLCAAGLPALVLGGSVLGAAYTGLRAPTRRPLRPRRGSVAWLAVGLVALYFIAPFRIGNTIWFDLRLAGIAWILGCVALAPIVARRVVSRVAATCLLAAMSSSAIAAHAAFDREVAPLFDVIDHMQPGKRVLPIVADLTSDAINPLYAREQVIGYYSLHAHFGSYYHVAKGGVSPLMAFGGSLPWVPLQVRSPAFCDRFKLTDPFNAFRVVSELDTTGSLFDYILVRGADARMTRVIERGAEQVARAGSYLLFVPRPSALTNVPDERP